MENKGELVIRWLEEPMDMACTLCKSGKKRNFKEGAGCPEDGPFDQNREVMHDGN